MRETKVNLKHLLEDIRDSYAIPLEEVILVELVANCLDSGAFCISFLTDKIKNTLIVVDNGMGMRRNTLVDYHNIAATAKVKGRGIGFAGIGAKLSLLIAQKVITETKGGYRTRCATEWYLKNETSAPWKFVPFSGRVPYPRGTAVSIVLDTPNHPLLAEDFIIKTIYNHYFPLFQFDSFALILKHIYKKGVEFLVNNRKIQFSPSTSFQPRFFQIRLGGARRKLAGVGYLLKGEVPDDIMVKGLGISTYGKIIKSGWEWIGVVPKENCQLYGVIETPALAEILTTNKMDFLKDSTSLKKYYTFRKAIQKIILPILEEFGEEISQLDQQKRLSSLTRDIERTLRFIVNDFPELVPLLGIRRIKNKEQGFVSEETPLVGLIQKEAEPVSKEDEEIIEESTSLSKQSKTGLKTGDKLTKKKKGPALSIGFEKRKENKPLARIVEDKIWINISHPAYSKAQKSNFEQYHILFCVAWALSHFLDDNRSPQEFINSFLAFWGREEKRTLSLFKVQPPQK